MAVLKFSLGHDVTAEAGYAARQEVRHDIDKTPARSDSRRSRLRPDKSAGFVVEVEGDVPGLVRRLRGGGKNLCVPGSIGNGDAGIESRRHGHVGEHHVAVAANYVGIRSVRV